MTLTKEKLEKMKESFMSGFNCTCNPYGDAGSGCPRHGKYDDIYDVVRYAFEEFFKLLIELIEGIDD